MGPTPPPYCAAERRATLREPTTPTILNRSRKPVDESWPFAHPLHGTTQDFDPLLALIADARFVLIGEATHGTPRVLPHWRRDHEAPLSARRVSQRSRLRLTGEIIPAGAAEAASGRPAGQRARSS